ncbi:hypothetical protein N9L68_04145 [bacterium]|nr:hypothetical protein [bacterium]
MTPEGVPIAQQSQTTMCATAQPTAKGEAKGAAKAQSAANHTGCLKTTVAKLGIMPEQIAAARAELDAKSQSQDLSVQNSFTQWATSNGYLKGQLSRQEGRREYIWLYMASMASKKHTHTNTIASHTSGHRKETEGEGTWMSEFQMRKDLGDAKTDAYLGSGKLRTRPCGVTGSEDAGLIEYLTPCDKERDLHWTGGQKDTTQTIDDIGAEDMPPLVSRSPSSDGEQGSVVGVDPTTIKHEGDQAVVAVALMDSDPLPQFKRVHVRGEHAHDDPRDRDEAVLRSDRAGHGRL